MDIGSYDIEILASLGNKLDSEGWSPIQPIATGFDGDDKDNRFVNLALAFLIQYDDQIRPKLCDGKSVKIEVITMGGGVAAVVDGLQSAAGFPIPVWTVANTLCQLGLHKYCETKF